ncbi:MAG: phosphodiester glycosidase family protein [Clostridia bacterium]|nr:phosphodiester glycosidase family protein [Clostridia bacterium]
MKKLFALLAALLLVCTAGAFAMAEEDDDDPVFSYLPIDFSPGMPLDRSKFTRDSYVDPSISVKITTGDENGVLYWIADVEIDHPSQLRTAAAESFDKKGTEYGSVLARRMNAVLAVDGDFYCYASNNDVHVTIRQGITFQNSLLPRPCQDVLLIDEDGDFHGVEDPRAGDVGTEINGKRIINAFYFGPLLVNNGAIRVKAPSHMGPEQPSQRVAIAQTGRLKYRVIVTGPNRRGSKAFNFDQWRAFVAGMDDIQVAYNLDGGHSAVLIFNFEKINDPENRNERPLSDIIYFASYWPNV